MAIFTVLSDIGRMQNDTGSWTHSWKTRIHFGRNNHRICRHINIHINIHVSSTDTCTHTLSYTNTYMQWIHVYTQSSIHTYLFRLDKRFAWDVQRACWLASTAQTPPMHAIPKVCKPNVWLSNASEARMQSHKCMLLRFPQLMTP
jgi:hypothetical protein